MQTDGKEISFWFPDVVISLHKASNEVRLIAYTILMETYTQNQANALMPINML